MVAGMFKMKTYVSFQLLLTIAPFSPTVEENSFSNVGAALLPPHIRPFTVHLIQFSRVIPLLYIFTCDLNERVLVRLCVTFMSLTGHSMSSIHVTDYLPSLSNFFQTITSQAWIQADHKEARAASTGPQRAAAAQGQRLRGGRFHGPVELAKTCTCGVSSCRQRHKVPARPRPQQLIDTDEAWGREEV